jgi:hypothetical protein
MNVNAQPDTAAGNGPQDVVMVPPEVVIFPPGNDAAKAAAMNDCLTRIGFNAAAVQLLIQHGVVTAEAFRLISYASMGPFTESLAKQPLPRTAGRPANVAPVFPYTAIRNLKALRAWLDYRYVRNDTLDVTQFTNHIREKWLLRVDVLDDAI